MNNVLQITFELNEIRQTAQKLLAFSKGYKVFSFSGELGAGKTTLISALCTELGVDEIVSSPTFSIVQQYTTGKGENIYHLDLYRIKSDEEAVNSGLEDCLLSGDVCLVEWPENAPAIFPPERISVTIEIGSTEKRNLIARILK